ncbi:MAG TPA: efflux RND transporter permease subunit, partial [Aminobacteriaceae bacterium]|nr:efflux RND transporter permease subunit [Aminobacteriaceae bacterium]
ISQPIQLRFNELIAGVRGDIAIKLYGDDLTRMGGVAQQVASVLRTVPGAADVKVEQTEGFPTLDVQFLGYASGEPMPETRWIDRMVCEENIVQTWEQLVAKYRFFMPKPFRDIDPVTLGRRDDPPGFRVFREAAVNLLIHQDYGDHSRKAVIKFFRDGIQFWNPGDVFGDDSRLFEPGEKEVRNPQIAMAMRRISMCEQAGTGMRMMRDEWRKLGHSSPVCRNDRAWKAFELFVPGLDTEADMASDLLKAMFGVVGATEIQPGTDSVPSLSQVCPKSI